MHFALRNECSNHEPYLCGVTLPPSLKGDTQAEAICDTYRKQVKQITVLMAILPIPAFFIPYFSIGFAIFMFWTLLVCIIFFVPFGMFYCNKQDKKISHETRFGNGITLNLARPWGKILTVFLVICMLTIPATAVFCLLEEFVPIKLNYTNETLVASQINTDYSIPRSDMSDISLLTELPRLSKSSGSAMDPLYKGNFWSRKLGHCEVFLNPENTYFIQLTADDTLYFFSAAKGDETLALYDELMDAE